MDAHGRMMRRALGVTLILLAVAIFGSAALNLIYR
jgi:hypothetical protein